MTLPAGRQSTRRVERMQPCNQSVSAASPPATIGEIGPFCAASISFMTGTPRQGDPGITLYDLDEAAAILRVTPSWLRERTRPGNPVFPCEKMGRATMFTPAQLAEIVEIRARPGVPWPRPAAPLPTASRKAPVRLAADVPPLEPRLPPRLRDVM